MGDNMVKKAEYFILGNEGELYFLKKIFWEKQKGRSIWMCLKVLLYGKNYLQKILLWSALSSTVIY